MLLYNEVHQHVVSLLVYEYTGCVYRTIVCFGNVYHLISKINIFTAILLHKFARHVTRPSLVAKS